MKIKKLKFKDYFDVEENDVGIYLRVKNHEKGNSRKLVETRVICENPFLAIDKTGRGDLIGIEFIPYK